MPGCTKSRVRSSGTGHFFIRKRGAITLPVLLDSQSRKRLKGQTVHFGSLRNCFPLNKCPKIGMNSLWGPKRFPEEGSFSRHTGLPPASIHLKSSGSEIYISFSCEEESQQYPETKAEKIARLSQYGKDELLSMCVGIDRGVVTPFLLSDGKRFDYSQTQKDRLKASERRKKHYQRMMARRIKGSSNWKKAKEKARRCNRYAVYTLDEILPIRPVTQ